MLTGLPRPRAAPAPSARRDLACAIHARAVAVRAMRSILDGGMGHLLKQDTSIRIEGLPYDEQSVASALACQHFPDAVVKAHRQYIDAGCTVLTTNSFSATPYHFKRARRTEDYADVAAARLRRLLPGLICCELALALVSSFALCAARAHGHSCHQTESTKCAT